MRMSRLFGRTLRETPADAEMASHRLLLRAGMIRPLGTGLYTFLPLGWRVLSKLQQVLREEMDAVGGQEMLMPVVNPAEVWQASGRWETVDDTLLRFRDRNGHDMLLAMTHEEVVADLLRREVDSWRQLPATVYHIQTKFRDELRSRGGLIRVREFVMADAYSVHADIADLEAYYPRMLQAYRSIFARCEVDPVAVEADSGMMGGSASHEFVLLNLGGEDTIVSCDACTYAANAEQAVFAKPPSERGAGAEDDLQPIAEVATPGCTSIEQVARYVGVHPSQTLKAVFFVTEEPSPTLIFAVIRGDLEVNEAKLSKSLGGLSLRAAEEGEIQASGAVPGYASPMGVRGARVIADDSVHLGVNFVTGANREGYHLTGVNYGRDFAAEIVTDIALARDGDRCPRCLGTLHARRGIELGHCFKLGTRYTAPAGITYQDVNGEEKHIVMGSYGIGLGRLMAAIVEEHHDEHGILWPARVAPYTTHLVSLVRGDELVAQADALYGELTGAGIDVLYDDRPGLSAGVRFNDADLIGCPLRLTFSQRSLKSGGVEAKLRASEERRVIPVDGIQELVSTL
ncbi:MAG: proline--tRNA ligase [Anaerolineae bacterium]|nr:proline--tRNA ligase [Anaerolineae bacterium]